MSEFGDCDYWNYRYARQQGTRYEWLSPFSTLIPYLQPCMTKGKQTRILNIGCGNSQIQDKLYQAGYHHIYNNDISTVVIKHLKLSSQHPEIVYQVMDVTEMTYPDKTFDIVIDKTTIDSLMCSDHPDLNVAKMIYHSYRVLEDGGFYFCVSYAKPSQRLFHIERRHVKFEITVTEIQEENRDIHYLYIGRKLPMEASAEKYEEVMKEIKEQEEKEKQEQKEKKK